MTTDHIIIGAGGGSGSGDATSIQGVDVTATPPTDGQVLTYNDSTGEWEPAEPVGGSATPGGSDTYVQFNDGGSALGGDSGFTYDGAGVVSISDALAIGSSPASAGVLRLPTTFTINARNNADNADLPVLRTDTIDNLYLGTTSSWSGGPQVAALHTYVTSAGQINIGTGSTTRLQISSSGVNLYNADPLTFGSSGAAASGLIRLPNAGAIKARNTGNSLDYNLITLDSSNYVTVGHTSQTYVQLGATANDFLVGDASGQIMRAQSGALTVSRPISQSRTTNSSTGTLNDVSIGDNFHIEFTNATGPTVTGFTGGVAGRILYVTFTAAGIIAHQAGASTAANQIKTGSGLDISVAAGETIQFIYDAANSRWLPVGVGI